MSNDDQLAAFSPELGDAFDSYRSAPSAESWTSLSQIYIGVSQVLDALKAVDPAFPDPYPLAAADVADGAFYQWPLLPEPEMVREAVLAAISRHDHA